MNSLFSQQFFALTSTLPYPTLRRHRLFRLTSLSLVTALLSSIGPSAFAMNWQGNTGNWNTPGNWDLNKVPGTEDAALISNGGTAQLTNGAASASTVQISNASRLAITDASLSISASLLICPTNTLGSVSLDGNGSLTVGNTLFVGDSGSGSFIQNSGTLSISTALYMARYASGTATYTMNGGSVSSAYEHVGAGGVATFSQSGGNNLTSTLNVGTFTGSQGSFNLSGSGVLTAYIETIGRDTASIGSFTQSGGIHNVTNTLYVGNNGSANYTLSDGLLTAANEYVGCHAAATFTQSGGTHSVTNSLNLAPSSNSLASYHLNGGSLQVATLIINPNATFTQSGGTHSVTNSLNLAPSSGSRASYHLNGGSLQVATLIIQTNASFTQSGGSLSASTISASGGTISLNSGTLAIRSFNNSARAFIWLGGTLQMDAGGSGYSGAPLTVPATATLTGSGKIAASVSLLAGASLAPGSSPGVLTINSVAFASDSSLQINLNGTTLASQYDQLKVNGSVNLNSDLASSSFLHLLLGYAPTRGDSYLIIDNDGSDPILGTFASLPQDSQIVADYNGHAYAFQIDYFGGTGNDVVLTAIPEPASLSLLALAAFSLLHRRKTRA